MAAKHRVEVAGPALRQIRGAFDWIQERSPDAAERWWSGLFAAIRPLETMPEQHALAPESSNAPVEIRQLLYGKRPGIYRVLYTIRRDLVLVLHCGHGARRRLRDPMG